MENVSEQLTKLLKTFRTDELSEEAITEEVERVRQEIYDRKQEEGIQRRKN